MENMISVSKASKLLGIKRSELNEQLRASNISTFEGMVDFEQVKAMAPAISLCESEIMDRVRIIRDNPLKSLKSDVGEQSRGQLETKLHKLTTDLLVETRTVEHYEQILVTLARKLGDLQTSDNDGERKVAASLCEWLRAEIRTE